MLRKMNGRVWRRKHGGKDSLGVMPRAAQGWVLLQSDLQGTSEPSLRLDYGVKMVYNTKSVTFKGGGILKGGIKNA